MTLNASQIVQAASSAGFTVAELPIAYAIAMAESGGNASAHNSTPPDDSYGLWQINMYGNLGPARRKQFGISNNTALYDPTVNAKAAHMIYKSSGWNAWSTYKSGAYKKYLPHDQNNWLMQVANDAGIPTVAKFLTGTANKAKGALDVGGAITAVGEKLFTGVADFIGIIVALTLLVVGAIILARKQVDKTAGAVAGVVPQGAAIKAVTAKVASK